MGVCKRRLRIVMVPVPTLSGPTSGRVIEEELEEWARQARRWTIGAAEVFHYFMVKSNNIPFFTALSWGITFIIYYGNYLSLFIIIIFTVTKFSNLIAIGSPDFSINNNTPYTRFNNVIRQHVSWLSLSRSRSYGISRHTGFYFETKTDIPHLERF